MPQGRLLIAATLLVVATVSIYATRLSVAPIYLIHDEVHYSLQAVSIARTAHDLNGRFMPLYFSEPEFVAGRDPMVIYATALVLKILPLSETSVRLSTALVGVLNVLLVVVLARRLFDHDAAAIAAGLILALSPGHFIHSRMALSVLFPLPFVLAWLIYLRRYEDTHDANALKMAGAALVVGIYSYLAAMIMMPLYFLLMLLVVRPVDGAALRRMLRAAAILLVPFVLWQMSHPERFGELLGAYQAGGATDGSFARGVPALFSLDGLRFRLAEWFSFFNPDALFFSGDASMTNSTRQAGVFPLACAILIPVGLFRLWRGTRFEKLILVCFLTAPLAIVLTGTLNLHRYRALVVLPFGALVATYGLKYLWTARHSFWRWMAILLVVSMAVQFSGFYATYFGAYRAASSVWFGRNLKGALVTVLEQRATPDRVFLSDRIPYGGVSWRLYARMLGHDAASDAQQTVGDAFDPSAPPAGSWLVVTADEARGPAIEPAGWVRQQTVAEPNGDLSFMVYRKMN